MSITTQDVKNDQTPNGNDQPVEEPTTEEEKTEVEEEKNDTPPPVEEINDTDYKEKFSNSTRENQVILSKNKDLEDRIDKLTNIEDPTKEDLETAYPNYEFMSDSEQELAKSNLKTQKLNLKTQSMLISNETKQAEAEAIRVVYKNNPDLALKQAEFEAYIKKPSHKGASVELLAKAFLTDFAEEIKDAKAPEPKPKQKDSALETGSGGADAPTTPSVTDDEAEKIRKTDPQRYNQLIKKGII